MNQKTEPIKSTPLKNTREVAAMLKTLSVEDRLRIEGAIAWAMMPKGTGDGVTTQTSS